MGRLLIGERNPEHRSLLKDIFSRNAPSMIVDFAANGEEVLRYLSEQAPNHEPMLMVLDSALPSIFSGSFVRLITTVKRYAKIPIVILADQAGADYYSLRAAGLVTLSLIKPSLAGGWELLAKRIVELAASASSALDK
jgi:CheY-like chemotaxis protein